LLVGDESALPAIGAALDALGSDDVAKVFVVVDSPEHHYPLPTNAGIEVTWLHRHGSDDPEALLVNAISAADLPDGAVHAFVHGEAGEVRSVRHLLVDRGVDVGAHSISAYWRRDHTDEAWREIKRGFMSQPSD
jgi:NADPH-dependent ferric siderophore reductase